MAVVKKRLHGRKELWFPYLVCKNNEFFAWRKTDTRGGTANWLRLNGPTKIKPLPLNSEIYGQTI